MNKKEFKKFFKCNSLSKENTEEFNSGGIIVGYEKDKKQERIYYIDDNNCSSCNCVFSQVQKQGN